MTKRTRLFLMVSGGVLIAGLATGLIASYMGLSAIALGGPDGPADLKYVPADARLLAYADVSDLMSSGFRQKLSEYQPHGQHQNDLQAQTGVNPETDIDSVIFSVAGTNSELEHERTLVLARGRFDEVRIEHFVREHGGQVSDYKGKRVLRHTPEKGSETAVAFIEPGLLGFGSVDSVRHAIDLADGGLSITANDDVMGLVRSIDDGNAWAVGRFDAMASRARLPRAMTDRLPPITWFAASGQVSSGLQGLLRVEASDEDAARNLREVVQGFVALARLQVGPRSALNTVINSLQLGGTGKTVSLEFSVPASAVDALASELPRAPGPGNPGDPSAHPRELTP